MLGQVSCTRFFAKNVYKVQHVLWCGDAVDPGVVVFDLLLEGSLTPSCLQGLCSLTESYGPLVSWPRAERAPPITTLLVPQHATGKKLLEATQGPS